MEKKNNDDKPKIAVALEYTPGTGTKDTCNRTWIYC